MRLETPDEKQFWLAASLRSFRLKQNFHRIVFDTFCRILTNDPRIPLDCQ